MSDPNSESLRVCWRSQWVHWLLTFRDFWRSRWVPWLLTLVTVTLAGVFLIPLVRSQPESMHNFFGRLAAWQRIAFVFALCIAFTALLFRLFEPRVNHLRHLLKRPPIWLAWAAASVALCSVDLTIGLSRGQYTASICEWLGYAGGSVVLVLFYVWLTTPAQKVSGRKKETPGTVAGVTATGWPSLEAWLHADEPAKHDFLGNYAVAERLKLLFRTSRCDFLRIS